MKRKYWYLIIGGAVLVAFFLIRSCQPAAAPVETPQVPTLIPVNSITPTPKPQLTNTPVKPTSIPSVAASPTAKPQPTSTQPAPSKPTDDLGSNKKSHPDDQLGMDQFKE